MHKQNRSNSGSSRGRDTSLASTGQLYREPRLYVIGKTAELLQGGNRGSQEDFAKRFKSKDSDK